MMAITTSSSIRVKASRRRMFSPSVVRAREALQRARSPRVLLQGAREEQVDGGGWPRSRSVPKTPSRPSYEPMRSEPSEGNVRAHLRTDALVHPTSAGKACPRAGAGAGWAVRALRSRSHRSVFVEIQPRGGGAGGARDTDSVREEIGVSQPMSGQSLSQRRGGGRGSAAASPYQSRSSPWQWRA